MKVLVGDFNGDGRDDVMKFDVPASDTKIRGLWVGLSNGIRFVTGLWQEWETNSRMKVLAGDFDGDHTTDVMKIDVPAAATSARGLWVGRSGRFPFESSLISGVAHLVSLDEMLSYDRNGTTSVHDITKYISEGGGRKWILTNSRFESTWVPRFWEEVDAPPAAVRFSVQVDPSAGQPGGHWTAARVGNIVYVMTDFDGARVRVQFPVSRLDFRLTRRSYVDLHWGPPAVLMEAVRTAPDPQDPIVEVRFVLPRKALATIEIR
jgi:hypothetical protein